MCGKERRGGIYRARRGGGEGGEEEEDERVWKRERDIKRVDKRREGEKQEVEGVGKREGVGERENAGPIDKRSIRQTHRDSQTGGDRLKERQRKTDKQADIGRGGGGQRQKVRGLWRQRERERGGGRQRTGQAKCPICV